MYQPCAVIDLHDCLRRQIQFVMQLGGFFVTISIKMSVLLDNKTFYNLWTNIVMFGDLVRVEMFMWQTTSFDPFFANLKLGKKLWEGKKDNIRMLPIWISGTSLTVPQQQCFPGIVTGQEMLLFVGCLTSPNMLMYLRDGSAQTILRAAILRQKLQIKLSTSPSHSVLTPGQPIPALTL